jgi:uncharacterized membrane protein YphA (DoxX/SURF4 family)
LPPINQVQFSTPLSFFAASPWPYRLLRLGIGALFVWAGAVKLLDPRAFASAIANYAILPDPLVAPAALGLPALELLAGIGLLLDIALGFRLTLGLLLLFMGVLAWAGLKGLDVDCGCFSADEIRERGSLQTVFVRDVALAAGVLLLSIRRRAKSRTPTQSIALEDSN